MHVSAAEKRSTLTLKRADITAQGKISKFIGHNILFFFQKEMRKIKIKFMQCQYQCQCRCRDFEMVLFSFLVFVIFVLCSKFNAISKDLITSDTTNGTMSGTTNGNE